MHITTEGGRDLGPQHAASVDAAFADTRDVAPMLDVLANDRGGTAKRLFSLDQSNPLTVTTTALTQLGARVTIQDGQVYYDPRGVGAIAALAAGETAQDTFTYAIQLANGAISTATVRVSVTGPTTPRWSAERLPERRTFYEAAPYALRVAVADLDGDGRQDLVVNTYADNSISSLRAHGDGTFEAALKIDIGMRSWGLAVSDINQDGLQDVIVGNGAGELTVLLQNPGWWI